MRERKRRDLGKFS